MVGGVYAANTVGAIVGALGFSLLVIPVFGTVGAERLLIGLGTVSGLVTLLPLLGSSAQGAPIRRQARSARRGVSRGPDRHDRRRRLAGLEPDAGALGVGGFWPQIAAL